MPLTFVNISILNIVKMTSMRKENRRSGMSWGNTRREVLEKIVPNW